MFIHTPDSDPGRRRERDPRLQPCRPGRGGGRCPRHRMERSARSWRLDVNGRPEAVGGADAQHP